MDTSLIGQYDVVISIGRTVQCCFAHGVPVYCYDHFGGPGYIDPQLADKHGECNYSGRSDAHIRTAHELKEDIVSGFCDAVRNLDFLKQYAQKKFSFDTLFESLFNEIESLNPLTGKDKLVFSEAYRVKSRLACYHARSALMSNLGVAQVYWASEGGLFSEENSIIFVYSYKTEIVYSLTRNLPDDAQWSILRFDPDMRPCACDMLGSTFIPVNCVTQKDTRAIFCDADPQYITLDKVAAITFSAAPLTQEDMHDCSLAMEGQKSQERGKRKPLQDKIRSFLFR